MKLIVCSLAATCLFLFVANAEVRQKRYAPVFEWLATGGRCSGCPRRCLDDRAVIAGYCCGCARDSDYLPINCPGIRGTCPADGRRLCRDYDYMLDCCCP